MYCTFLFKERNIEFQRNGSQRYPIWVRDFGKVTYTLLYSKWITNKDLLYSTGNSAQCYVLAWMRGEFGGERIHVYVRLSPFTVHLKQSQHYQPVIPQYKIKDLSLKKIPSIPSFAKKKRKWKHKNILWALEHKLCKTAETTFPIHWICGLWSPHNTASSKKAKLRPSLDSVSSERWNTLSQDTDWGLDEVRAQEKAVPPHPHPLPHPAAA